MKKDSSNQVRYFFIVLSICFLVYTSIQWTLSWHNLDTIHNLQIYTNQINEAGFKDLNNQTVYIPFSSITDTADDYVSRPLENYYVSSVNDLRKYFLISIFNAIFLGLCIGGLK
jgi:hypothetical protein